MISLISFVFCEIRVSRPVIAAFLADSSSAILCSRAPKEPEEEPDKLSIASHILGELLSFDFSPISNCILSISVAFAPSAYFARAISSLRAVYNAVIAAVRLFISVDKLLSKVEILVFNSAGSLI